MLSQDLNFLLLLDLLLQHQYTFHLPPTISNENKKHQQVKVDQYESDTKRKHRILLMRLQFILLLILRESSVFASMYFT